MIERGEWLSRILRSIEIVSDIDFQIKIWVKGEEQDKYFSSYAEHMCAFFDDSDFEGFLGEYWPQFGLSEDLHKKLIYLRDCLEAYNKDEALTDDEIVKDPEWIKITKVAKNTLEAFRQEIDAS